LQNTFTRLEVHWQGYDPFVLILAVDRDDPSWLTWEHPEWVRNPDSGLRPWP
jgi:hypothetical protein